MNPKLQRRLKVGLGMLAAAICCSCAQDIQVELGDSGSGPAADLAAADVALGDLGDPGDSGGPSDAGSNAREDGGDDGGVAGGEGVDAGALACQVDPFERCEDPDEAARTNNRWADALPFYTTSVGCIQGDDFSPLDHSQSSVLCQTEPADYYRLTIVGCDTKTIIAEIRMRPLTECRQELYNFEVLSGGRVLECGDEQFGMECRMEGETQLILVRIEPARTVFSWQFGITSDLDDVRLDYELSIVVR